MHIAFYDLISVFVGNLGVKVEIKHWYDGKRQFRTEFAQEKMKPRALRVILKKREVLPVGVLLVGKQKNEGSTSRNLVLSVAWSIEN